MNNQNPYPLHMRAWIAANGGDTPRESSAILYDIWVDMPGVGPVLWQGVKPCGRRPPAGGDAMPRPVGFNFTAAQASPGVDIQFQFDEWDADGPCPGGTL